ncbi:hypothetical protein cyc_02969 [Cyclospora cayetanensis]|uniref:Protein kinase domain-containing protein n=1 Tax=Cyclospora cayetanensis TaxID=88456 RepID=A0A1D3CWV9_9EIME|nr:hypothetical protein cyc_02969 [Cyclospora cayetanensis]
MLGATEPMGFPDHKSLLRSLLAIEGVSSETERLRETLSAARSRRTYVETCISPLPPSLSPEGVSSPIYPAEGGAAAEAASEGAPSTLRLLRQEAEAAVQEALATPRLLSMEGGTLRAAQAVRLCGQAWLEGAYIPEFDETDEYTEDTDVGYTALELTQDEFLVAFCGSLMEEATGGPSGMHPLVTMGVEPAVDESGASPADLTTPLDDSAVYDCFNLKVVFKRNTTGCDAHRELVLPSGALLGGRYRIQHEVGAAAFSRCLQGIDVCTGERVCLKVMKNEKEYLDQSLDEVAVLRLLRENGDPDAFRFLRLLDCLYFRGHVVLVTELLDEDLYTFSTALKRHREPSFWTLGRIQVAIRDVLLALKFIHALQIIHGDLKPENILACFTKPLAEFQRHRQEQDRLALRQQAEQCSSSHRVSDNGDASKKLDGSAVGPAAGFDPQALDLFRVKVIDFGNCCFTSDELVVYTQSRCYRAPEVLLELPYCQKIDIWSLGCIVYELWTGDMLLGCHSVPSLLAKMVGIVGPIPNYMARNSPLKHQLIDVEGYLYQFRDSIAETQEQQQHQHAIGFHEPSVNMALRSSEDTLFNVLGGAGTRPCPSHERFLVQIANRELLLDRYHQISTEPLSSNRPPRSSGVLP